jgi:hypothetical protein
MAACAIEVFSMTRRSGQTIEAIGEERLDEWNRWMNHGPKPGPKEPTCNLGRVQTQKVAAGSHGGSRDVPLSVDEVERVVRQFSPREKHLIEEHYSNKPRDVAARACGLTYNGFYRAMQRVYRRLHSELY